MQRTIQVGDTVKVSFLEADAWATVTGETTIEGVVTELNTLGTDSLIEIKKDGLMTNPILLTDKQLSNVERL